MAVGIGACGQGLHKRVVVCLNLPGKRLIILTEHAKHVRNRRGYLVGGCRRQTGGPTANGDAGLSDGRLDTYQVLGSGSHQLRLRHQMAHLDIPSTEEYFVVALTLQWAQS
ncbi:hypothetical protein TM48_03770 [Mycobacterium shottsii]|uniref:Uncharacterized protein n=1 Tax=Mycobacterium shottsii TaxID=133549 RepID=A0A7I7LIZ4_9MYCO|nr:hypothetical protein TM48_03770 [Mycobacterium shottsii]BBX59567.1 hypothetical protein MSHO_49120 [Mycobacterium shottsii]